MNLRIHISGASGSGKSTLGEKLQKIYDDKIFVIDTDTFFQPDNENGKLLFQKKSELTDDLFKSFYKDLFIKNIEKISNEYKDKIVVYVGLLDNMSFYGFFVEYNFDHKFYLDVSTEVLLKRFYNRLSTFSDDYWKRVASGDDYINSSKGVIYGSTWCIEQHQNMKYEILSYENLFEKVKGIINKELNFNE